MKSRWILLIILILGATVRFADLKINPPALNQDEAVNGYDAFCLGANGHDHHGNFLPFVLQSFNDWTSPTLTYITIPFLKIFGLTEFGVRFPVALMGVISIWLLYLLLLEMGFVISISLAGSFLLAIMPWHITASRWGHPYGVVTFLLLLMFIFFFRAVKYHSGRKAGIYLALASIMAVLLSYGYPTQKFFVPCISFCLAAIFYFRRWKKALLFFIPTLLLISPQFIITMLNPEKYNYRFNGVSYIDGTRTISEYISLFFERYVKYFSTDFLFGNGDPDIMHQVPGMGNSYIVLALPFYTGLIICLYFLISKKEFFLSPLHNLSLLAWLLLFPVAASLTWTQNHLMRAIHGMPLIIIYSCVFFQFISAQLKDKTSQALALSGLLIFSFADFAQYQKMLFKNYTASEDTKFQYQFGIKQCLAYARANEAKYDTITVDGVLNQPYIIYLYYSSYDPEKLYFKEGKVVKHDIYQTIGKYQFVHASDEMLNGAKEVYEVRDTKLWFSLLAKNRSLHIIKR